MHFITNCFSLTDYFYYKEKLKVYIEPGQMCAFIVNDTSYQLRDLSWLTHFFMNSQLYMNCLLSYSVSVHPILLSIQFYLYLSVENYPLQTSPTLKTINMQTFISLHVFYLYHLCILIYGYICLLILGSTFAYLSMEGYFRTFCER